jgi:hypothetical protein
MKNQLEGSGAQKEPRGWRPNPMSETKSTYGLLERVKLAQTKTQISDLPTVENERQWKMEAGPHARAGKQTRKNQVYAQVKAGNEARNQRQTKIFSISRNTKQKKPVGRDERLNKTKEEQ